ncbi:hypothetical protein HYW83_01640 [Candidatus Peregrinibacteria bacterium]|nr:hypothetical protein [Candidatus Peregrinibacteria bacterium]
MQSPLRISNITFALALILLTASAVYGVFQFRGLQGYKQALVQSEESVQKLGGVFTSEKKNYQTLADERAKKQAELGKKLLTILPPDENYTDLTRQFDNYFADHDRPGNPILQSSLRFGKGTPMQDIPDVSMLQVSMNLEATRDNFLKFLQYVSNSGSLDTITRLMDINSVQLNFPEGGEVVQDLGQKINFTVDMNAYYLTPKVPR